MQRFFIRILLVPFQILLVCGVIIAQEAAAPTPTIREEVTVTANRIETRIGETPASVVTISKQDIKTSAAPTIDDVLRQSAGFSIFRRSSSRNANPTTQGVSLRGVGSSGASRSLVLFDGVPLNDPFGGWVQWNRVSPIEVENVEILRGGASSLYGDTSLSGAVKVHPRRLDDKHLFSADVFGGTQHTFSGSGFAGLRSGGWQGIASATIFQTRGYKLIEDQFIGPVDSPAGVRSSNFSGKLTRSLGKGISIFARPSYFGEVRANGTGLQTNRTHIRQLVLGGDLVRTPCAFRLDWRTFGGTQVYDQTFTAVNATRTIENLIRIQRVPAQNAGASVQSSVVFGDHTLVGGVEIRNVRGMSNEIAVTAGVPVSLVDSGGRQAITGVFFQDFVRIGDRLVVAASIRYDRWRNYAAFSTVQAVATGATTVNSFADRSEAALSPQLSILYRLSSEFSVYATGSRSFRSPTLNELYRSFRVGNVSTLANDELRAERADNFESGISFSRRNTTVRVNAFWTQINRPIANVTLSSTPALITRQRQNAGQTRSRGIEIEAETRVRRVTLRAGYLFVDPTVVSFPENPQIEGLQIPQVARNQFTFQVNYVHDRWTTGVQARGSSAQFDDDLNNFRLEPYAQVDLFFARTLNDSIQVYTAVENIFNSRYSVGRTPLRTISSPLNLRVGVRWK